MTTSLAHRRYTWLPDDVIEITPPLGKKFWDESKHPRHPPGSEQGGEFASAGGGESDGKTITVYHVTPVENLPAIMDGGLHPKIGDRASLLDEPQPAIYTFNSKEDAEEAITNWLGEQFDDDVQLALLEVTIPVDAQQIPGAGYERLLTDPIKPESIKVVDEDFGGHEEPNPAPPDETPLNFNVDVTVDPSVKPNAFARSRAILREQAEGIAHKMDFDPANIVYSTENKTFTLNGKTFNYHGGYQLGDSKITLYMQHVNRSSILGITAHEIGHRKFQNLIDAYKADYALMMKDPGPPPDPNHRYWWGKRGGTDAMMKPDGLLRPPYDEKYPIYQAWTQIQNARPSLEQDDGITDYSKAWWKEWEAQKATTDIAYHETIAEMAKVYNTNHEPVVVGKGWQALYELMDEVWAETPDSVRNTSTVKKLLLLARASAHTEWMNECVPNLMGFGKEQEVAVAACLNMWRDAWEEEHPDGADDPGPDRPDPPDESESAQTDKQLRLACARVRRLLKTWNESMITREVIDGRGAMVAHVTDDMEPASVKDATMIKIIFDDGEIVFAGVAVDPKKKKSLQIQMQIAREQSMRLLKVWDESKHPRVPAGSGDDSGEFASAGGGGGGGGSVAPSKSKPKTKKNVKKEDFEDAAVRIEESSTVDEERFIEAWNNNISMDPEEFKQHFLGGLRGTMTVSARKQGQVLDVSGDLYQDGQEIGKYSRQIDLKNKIAYSGYFRLKKEMQGQGIGKKMLAGNIDMYEDLGVDLVSVGAGLDVGGHAWAKYGYVPLESSWDILRPTIRMRYEALKGGTAATPGVPVSRFEELPDATQETVYQRWLDDSLGGFLSTEVQNWREGGGSLNEAKHAVSSEFNVIPTGDQAPDWAKNAVAAVREQRRINGRSSMPYTDAQILEAMELDYDPQYGDGRDDPEVLFVDSLLQEPNNKDTGEQGTLPGMGEPDYSKRLTKEMRDEIKDMFLFSFGEAAEETERGLEPPDHLKDAAGEYQRDYWADMDDRERLHVAEGFQLNTIAPEPVDAEEQPVATDTKPDDIMEILKDDDPRAMWRIADHPLGKQLLLGTSWSGNLYLSDPQVMERFNKYVGRKWNPTKAARAA